jgi:hypothetical protein
VNVTRAVRIRNILAAFCVFIFEGENEKIDLCKGNKEKIFIYSSRRKMVGIVSPCRCKISEILNVLLTRPRQNNNQDFMTMHRNILKKFNLASKVPQLKYNIN